MCDWMVHFRQQKSSINFGAKNKKKQTIKEQLYKGKESKKQK
jgi:hypothetical protein